ncbi:phytoene/squalene synthase family protein [Nocardia sp. alder85J]|uniref:phytoene/squalene synthase family protein n=1 Tax=Nocardia sp. alder85J TaxID=2862949 RepID=UPI001CD67BDA|nr:squalene/phytoene synthase family protein [Nocardia sp. alder85J]MCX4098751.1 squalene/phytoene synthase family protein [Nocardia sp. alder85J]
MTAGPAGPRTDPAALTAAYRHCRTIAATHGRTYFLATRLLSPPRRLAIHALYAFARTVDDIVDHGAPDAADRIDDIEGRLRARLDRAQRLADPVSNLGGPIRHSAGPVPDLGCSILDSAGPVVDPGAPAPDFDGPAPEAAGPVSDVCGPVPAAVDPVLDAAADTLARFRVDPAHVWTFLDAMRMDVPGTALFRNRYASMAELRGYMRGSAAAIGLQLLPILGTVVPVAAAEPAAAALGEAFQLTNFLRDVAEDLDRDRVYLPLDELSAFGVDPALLAHCRRTGHTDIRLRRALIHLIAANRALYRIATPGIDLLDPRVRPAIRTATRLYAGILDEIERNDYTVFHRRAVVPGHRRLRVAATEFTTAALRPGR